MGGGGELRHRPLKVAIAGLGTVGGGTVKLLQTNASCWPSAPGAASRSPPSATAIVATAASPVDDYAWYDDAVTMAREADADVVVELIGGADGAREAGVRGGDRRAAGTSSPPTRR